MLQLHESMHTPLTQMSVKFGHWTPAHRFARQLPLTQSCPAGHVTDWHGSYRMQTKLHEVPVPHVASQRLSGTHALLTGSQWLPGAQFTPAHGT